MEHSYHRAIKAGRAYRGQTVEKLAEATGLTENQIRHLETNKANHSVERMLVIAEAQNLPIEFYLYGPPLDADNPRTVELGSIAA